MPSKPPPLPPPFSSPLACVSPPAGRSDASNWINWSAILASASVSFALVVSVVAWIVTHPNKAAVPSESLSMAAMGRSQETIPQHAIEVSAEPPAPHRNPVIETIPALHRPDRLDKIAHRIPLVEETPPPLPPPVSPRRDPEPAAAQAAAQPAGETYGTQVLFLNNREAAADMARRAHKLLFVMHISGNFEDSCFT